MEVIIAEIGQQNIVAAFWIVIGGLLLSNAGLVIQSVVSHFQKINKMRADINEAFKEIRELKKKEKEK
ncbi:MAG: hypothetical protein KF802_01180 [Bdellovibrionaceae bacterium]|nr:hypothetical protein [Pseudobdellovibrionaceae bacterium]